MAGFWQSIFGGDGSTGSGVGPPRSPAVEYAWMEPRVEYLGSAEWEDRVAEIWSNVRGMSPAALWKSQPHLRTVVGFVARNIAQLGLPVYDRVSDTDRKRNTENDFSRALKDPGDGMSQYDLIFALVGDMMLYDRAYWLPYTEQRTGKSRIRRLPPAWVSAGKRTTFGTETFKVSLPNSGSNEDNYTEIPREKMIVFTGYSPTTNDGCSPAIEALKETLAEQIEATTYRKQVWQRGGRTSAVIQRPLEAPPWDKDAADRFREDWYSNYTGNGPKAGGTPVLEDGMSIQRIDFSANDMQWAEGAKLALVTVASAYYVNPTMIGILDNANFSNVREFRKMLYGDTLGPYIAQYEGILNTFGLSQFGLDPSNSYCEFNIREKLQGNFEEEAAILSTSIGAPFLTRNEGRARQNLPALPGGDDLITPLNVTRGGLASPTDTGTQNEDPTAEDPGQQERSRGRFGVKVRADETEQAQAARVIGAFFKRQTQVVRSRLGVKDAEDWWDEERWDGELADDLFGIAMLVSKSVATKTLDAIGFSPDEFDEDRTLAWLREVSERSAKSINEGTKARLEEALAGDDVPTDLDTVFAAQESRASMIAVSTTTLISGFATTEAAKQVAGEAGTKTWITGPNPRPEHASMDGETVPLSENFSNGAAWPGDGSALDAEDLSNCNCELQINVGDGGQS